MLTLQDIADLLELASHASRTRRDKQFLNEIASKLNAIMQQTNSVQQAEAEKEVPKEVIEST